MPAEKHVKATKPKTEDDEDDFDALEAEFSDDQGDPVPMEGEDRSDMLEYDDTDDEDEWLTRVVKGGIHKDLTKLEASDVSLKLHPSYILSFLLLGCVWMRTFITAIDIEEAVKKGLLPYLSWYAEVPKKLANRVVKRQWMTKVRRIFLITHETFKY